MSACASSYSNVNLPTSTFPGPTALGMWDDLYLNSGTSQSVYYGTTGSAPNRTMVFEYYTALISQPTSYIRFQIRFFEGAPGIVQFVYYQASNNGATGTIGVQSMFIFFNHKHLLIFSQSIGSGTGPALVYSHNSASVPAGSASTTTPVLTVTFNTNTHTMASSG